MDQLKVVDFSELGHGDWREAASKWPLRIRGEVICGGWRLGSGESLLPCNTPLSGFTTGDINESIVSHVSRVTHYEEPFRITKHDTAAEREAQWWLGRIENGTGRHGCRG